MLLAVLTGKGTYHGPEGSIALRAGMIGLVFPEKPGLVLSDPRQPYTLCYCRFAGRYAQQLAMGIILREKSRFFEWPRAKEIGARIRRMGNVRRVALPDVMGPAEVILAECLAALCTGPFDQSDPEVISEFALRDWLHAHVDQPTRLDDMAGAFGVSRSTLCRKVRRLTGATPQALHEQAKMEWAAFLLLNTGLSIKQIAHRLGYQDPLYFARVFRKHYGTSATRYRRKR